MDSQYIKLVWSYRTELNIRWTGFLDRIDSEFSEEWLEYAVSIMKADDAEPHWILLPSSPLQNVAKPWLEDNMGFNVVVDESLQLQPNVCRVVLLDKDSMAGYQILWINATAEQPVREEPVEKKTLFSRILSGIEDQ